MADSVLSILVKFAALDRLTQPLRTMGGASKAAARDLVAARKEVLGLEKQAAKIGGFKDQRAAIAKTHAELDIARRRVADLRAAMAQADGPTGRLARQLEGATGKLKRLDGVLEKQTGRLGTLRGELVDAGIDVDRLADAERRLDHSLGTANRKLEEQQAKAKRAADQASKLQRAQTTGANLRAGGVRALAGGAVIGRGAIGLAGEARDFQSILVDIGQKADLGTAATARLGKGLIAAAPRIAQLPGDLAAGIDTLAGLGLDVGRAQAIIAPIGRAATAYKAEITDLANASFSAIDNLHVPFDQTSRSLDIMAAAGKAGAFEIKDMAREFPALTAAAAGLGQVGVPAVADLAAAAQITRKGAGDSATAANNLLNLLNKINANETIANFKKFGIDVPAAMKKAARDGRSPIEEIIALTRKATGGDLSKLPQLFGDAQVQAALRPLLANTELYRKIRADALKANGTVEADFNNRVANDGTAKLARYNAQIERLKIIAGAQLLPVLNRVLEIGGNLADRFSAWADANPVLANGVLIFAAALGAILFVAGGLFIAIGSILGPIASLGFLLSGPASNVGFLVRGFQLLGGAARFLLSPIQLVIRGLLLGLGAIAAFVGLPVWLVGAIAVGIGLAALAIYNHWATISQGAAAIWTRIATAFSTGKAFLLGLVPGFASIGAAMLQGLLKALDPFALVQHILKLGGMAVTALKGALGIKSPSRVFAGIGGQMMAGLTVGLDAGVRGPLDRLVRAGAQFAGAGSLALAPPVFAAPPISATPSAASIAPTASRLVPGRAGAAIDRIAAIPARAAPLDQAATARVTALAARPAAPIATIAVRPVAPIGALAEPTSAPRQAAAQPPRSGDSYQITIQAASGMDEEALARLVMRRIADARRAADRSSYRDDA